MNVSMTRHTGRFWFGHAPANRTGYLPPCPRQRTLVDREDSWYYFNTFSSASMK